MSLLDKNLILIVMMTSLTSIPKRITKILMFIYLHKVPNIYSRNLSKQIHC